MSKKQYAILNMDTVSENVISSIIVGGKTGNKQNSLKNNFFLKVYEMKKHLHS